jgi:hypothetical protein
MDKDEDDIKIQNTMARHHAMSLMECNKGINRKLKTLLKFNEEFYGIKGYSRKMDMKCAHDCIIDCLKQIQTSQEHGFYMSISLLHRYFELDDDSDIKERIEKSWRERDD